MAAGRLISSIGLWPINTKFYYTAHNIVGKLNNIWSYFARHKYLITLVTSILIIGVLDDNSVRRYVMLSVRLNEVRAELETSRNQFVDDSLKLRALEANHKGVERVARERYFMKRPNEDVFVLRDKTMPN